MMSNDALLRVTDFHSWGDIIVEANTITQLETMAREAKSDNGIAALFTGSLGTGKTLAASYLAAKLGLPLYRVDLASIVSKYIGETEKNLDHLFERSQKLDIVLLFDEGDALFGKRTEVSDSHDRYANLETGYLLQKIEDHPGLVVLTSNARNNIDDAVIRRMAWVIDFIPPPPPWWLRILQWMRLK